VPPLRPAPIPPRAARGSFGTAPGAAPGRAPSGRCPIAAADADAGRAPPGAVTALAPIPAARRLTRRRLLFLFELGNCRS